MPPPKKKHGEKGIQKLSHQLYRLAGYVVVWESQVSNLSLDRIASLGGELHQLRYLQMMIPMQRRLWVMDILEGLRWRWFLSWHLWSQKMFEAIIELGCYSVFVGTLFSFLRELFCWYMKLLVLCMNYWVVFLLLASGNSFSPTMRVYHPKVQNLLIVSQSQVAGSVLVSVWICVVLLMVQKSGEKTTWHGAWNLGNTLRSK